MDPIHRAFYLGGYRDPLSLEPLSHLEAEVVQADLAVTSDQTVHLAEPEDIAQTGGLDRAPLGLGEDHLGRHWSYSTLVDREPSFDSRVGSLSILPGAPPGRPLDQGIHWV